MLSIFDRFFDMNSLIEKTTLFRS